MSREQSGEEDGVMETEVGPVGDENVETEVEFRPPRGTYRQSSWESLEQRQVSRIRVRQTESLGVAKPKWPEFELPNL